MPAVSFQGVPIVVRTLVFAATTLALTQVVAESEFDNYMQQQEQGFRGFLEERDREFSSFLKLRWKEFRLHQGFKRDDKPKPVKLPVAPDVEPKPPAVQKPVTPPAPAPQPRPEPIRQLPPPPPKGTSVELYFYGHKLNLTYDPAIKLHFGNRASEKAVAAHWQDLSSTNYKSLLEQLNKIRSPLGLNDWAFMQLVAGLSAKLHPHSTKDQTLLTWFLLTKSGYRVRIGYDKGGDIHLFVHAKQMVYDTPYLVFGGLRHYRLSPKQDTAGAIFTYKGTYPGAAKAMDMALRHMVKTNPQLAERKLKFDFGGKNYVINSRYDSNTAEFLDSYPQLDLEWYFESAVSPSAEYLLAQLRPLMEGRSELEATNLLLRFVQTAFEYKTDDEQFGYENYLFAEETLRFPYSDCEDRSILFAWLVRELVGLEVVGLAYPGHVAAAVHFSASVDGDSVKVRGKPFTIADPTYINAIVGMTMPQFAKHEPKVIPIPQSF